MERHKRHRLLRMTLLFLLPAGLCVCVGLLIGEWRYRRNLPLAAAHFTPANLRIIRTVSDRWQGSSGDSERYVEGKAIYIFRNRVNGPSIRVFFPPIAHYYFGERSCQFPYDTDAEKMPEFCRREFALDLAPGDERVFQADFAGWTNGKDREAECFVFGVPKGNTYKYVLVGSLIAEIDYADGTAKSEKHAAR